jgi:hypothetical protein
MPECLTDAQQIAVLRSLGRRTNVLTKTFGISAKSELISMETVRMSEPGGFLQPNFV